MKEINTDKIRNLYSGSNWDSSYTALFGGDVPILGDDNGPTACLGVSFPGLIPEEFEGKCVILGLVDGFKWKIVEANDECIWPLLVLVEED